MVYAPVYFANQESCLRAQEAAAEMLADSGVAELEARVLAFLYRHSGALRLLATIDDAAQLLLQACTLTALAALAGCTPHGSVVSMMYLR